MGPRGWRRDSVLSRFETTCVTHASDIFFAPTPAMIFTSWGFLTHSVETLSFPVVRTLRCITSRRPC
jgi:hypothetical protein